MAKKIFTDESLATFVDEIKSYINEKVDDLANNNDLIVAESDASLNSLWVSDSIEIDAGGTLMVDYRNVMEEIDALDSGLNGLAKVAKSGSYNDLTNKPTIPTKVSDLINDNGFIREGADDAFLTVLQVDDYIEVAGCNVMEELDNKASNGHGHGNIGNDGTLTTANAVVITGTNNKITASTITTTELGHLEGVTSNVQTQLDNKLSLSDLNRTTVINVADTNYTTLMARGAKLLDKTTADSITDWNTQLVNGAIAWTYE